MMYVLDNQVRLHFSHMPKDLLQRVTGQCNFGGHIDALPAHEFGLIRQPLQVLLPATLTKLFTVAH
ncbi:hypothetical protein D3C76_1221610 [compost metagenome]